ncbi:MAG: HAD-IA family hydrolase, partial [Thermoflavifilum sp.]|nr:HAD-IA family hydrolase [Thermoflavifilum sp.]
ADNELLKGLSREDSLTCLLQMTGKKLNAAAREQTLQEKNKLFLQYLEHMTAKDILPGVQELLAFLKNKHIKLAVASSSKNAKIVLQKTGLITWFDEVVDGTQLQRAKPDPEVFLKAAQRLHVAPRHAIVFEDAQAGVEAALAGGFYCVGIGDTNLLHQAHLVIPHFQALAIANLWKSLSDLPAEVKH